MLVVVCWWSFVWRVPVGCRGVVRGDSVWGCACWALCVFDWWSVCVRVVCVVCWCVGVMVRRCVGVSVYWCVWVSVRVCCVVW